MNAITLLKDDHKRVIGLFRQFEAVILRSPEMRDGVVRQALMELQVHSKLEEEIFYAECKKNLDESGVALIEDCYQAHAELDSRIEKFGGSDNEIREIISAVETHVSEEETSLFPMLEERIPEQLDRIGALLATRKKELIASPEFEDSRPEVTQNPNGGEQSRKIA